MASTESLEQDSDDDSYDEPLSFIDWLVQRPGTNWLCAVEAAFIEDKFNLYGLDQIFPHYKQCIDIILGGEPEEGVYALGDLLSEAIDLYGLIHARYILTPKGAPLMADKLSNGAFGLCPRFHCQRQPVLPVGLSESLCEHHTMLFCPRCEDVYEVAAADRSLMAATVLRTRSFHKGSGGGSASPGGGSSSSSSSSGPGPRARLTGAASSSAGGASAGAAEGAAAAGGWTCLPGLDGAFFGPSFPHMLLLQYPQFLGAVGPEGYVPRIFGFRVHNQRGAVPRSAGDSRGVYATSLAQPTPPVAGQAAGAPSAPAARAGVAARASPARTTRQSSLRQSPGDVAGSTDPVSVGAELVPLPSSALRVRHACAPATLAPFVFPVEGMPCGVPVYGIPRFDLPAPAAAAPPGLRPVSASCGASAPLAGGGGTVVVQEGVSYVVLRASGKPATSCAVPGGPKDDFSDDDDDEEAAAVAAAAGSGGQKRKRKA